MTPQHQLSDTATRKALDRLPRASACMALAYLLHGRDPGPFIRSILAGRWDQAALMADADNARHFYDWARLLVEIPKTAHGSEGNVRDWIKSGGLRGAQRAAQEKQQREGT